MPGNSGKCWEMPVFQKYTALKKFHMIPDIDPTNVRACGQYYVKRCMYTYSSVKLEGIFFRYISA